MEEAKRFIAYICPKCRQMVIVSRDVFALAAAPARIRCPCGKSELDVDFMGPHVRLRVPCLFCGREHTVTCDCNVFLRRRALAFSCTFSGLDCCYVGEEQSVYAAAARLEQAADRLEQTDAQGMFLDEIVMHEVLSELRDIARRGGVSCACGSRDWSMEVHYSSIELRCAGCGAHTRIPAATADDIDDICCRDKILIRPN